MNFLQKLKEKLNLNTPEDWNALTTNQIENLGGNRLLKKYSIFEIKCFGCPEGENIYNRQYKPHGFWGKRKNVKKFLSEIKEKLNLQTMEDWDNLTREQIILYGGATLFHTYTLFHLQCIGYPEGRNFFTRNKVSWNKLKIDSFLNQISNKLNLKTVEDWNLLTADQIKLNGGNSLLNKYSLYEIKCMGFPDGKDFFNKPNNFYNENENVLEFLKQLKKEYNLQSIEDWNLLNTKQIKNLVGGNNILKKYSLFKLKCLGYPRGENFFYFSSQTKNFWENHDNVSNFLQFVCKELNLKTSNDWNSITQKQIIKFGGNKLIQKYSMFDLKCIGDPNGKELFNKSLKKIGHWENDENIQSFLTHIKDTLHLHTIDDWNSLQSKQIISFGGSQLLNKYSLYEIKCLGCPNGKDTFNKPNKPSGYWNNFDNIQSFINELKMYYNLQSIDDWNNISKIQIENIGGKGLLNKFSLFDIKSIGCPEGTSVFIDSVRVSKFQPKPSQYWDNYENVHNYINYLKDIFNIKSKDDWKRISKTQIRSHGGDGFLSKFTNLSKKDIENFNPEIYEILTNCNVSGRSSQRWLFLQVQKLFPGEEIVEDYFHSEISRYSGSTVQFDVFLIQRNIAIEYHGKQHYEEIPSTFAPLEMHKIRDTEKEKLCKQFGIKLIIIPYWWDNNLDSLKNTIDSVLKAQ